MNTNFEVDMPNDIHELWEGYTQKQRNFLMYLMSEKYDQTEAYVKAKYGEKGAKTNSYKLVAKLKIVWDWMQYWKAHMAASEGVVTKNEILKKYSTLFRDDDDDTKLSVNNLLKIGQEISKLCVYYPDTKQDMAKKNLEMENLIKTKDLPLDVRKQLMQAVREQKKEAENEA